MNQPVEVILKDFADRSGIDDIKNFAEVFDTAKRTGGDLIKIIRSTGNIIRDKIEVKREIITMITAKKFESNIMNLIPFGIIVYLRMFSPDFLSPLYHNLFGILFMTAILVIYYGISRIAMKITSIEV
jgi:tight adherence protein B